MKAGRGDRQALTQVAVWLGLAAVYFVLGKLGLRLAVVHPSATAIWPPSGIALAAILLLGYRAWPGIFLGAFVVNAITAGSVATCLGIASGNTLEAVVGAWLVNRFAAGHAVLDTPRNTFKFVGLAGGVSTMIGATAGVAVLSLTGFSAWSDFVPVWITWWLGDATGDIIVAPLVLLWASDWRVGLSGRRALEAVALLLSLAATGVLVFGNRLSAFEQSAPLKFLCIPFLLWAAFRFGRREAATATALLSAIAVWGTIRGGIPVDTVQENVTLLTLQAFLAVISAMSLAVAAAVWERRRAEDKLREHERGLSRYATYLEQFAYAASHDLQEPLRHVSLFTELLATRYQGQAEDSDQWIGFILAGVRRMSELITGLLAFSSLVGTEGVRFSPVDMAEVAEAATKNLESMIAETGARICYDRLPSVTGDRPQLILLMQNLLANAIKYRDQAPPVIHIDARLESGQWVFSVRDNGIGIEAAYHETIFGLFKRLHGGAVPGAGLGLGIAKRIVELHHGRIWVESEPGAGATFYFAIPAVF